MNDKKSIKDRSQSREEFLETLQLEYIVAELRSKIYPLEKDRKYWSRVMTGKKEKIEGVTKLTGAPNIFNDTYIKELMYKRIIKETGFPNFLYRNEEIKEELQRKDFQHYYWFGTDFTIETEDDTLEGTLKSINEQKTLVKMLVDGEQKVFNLSQITRIL